MELTNRVSENLIKILLHAKESVIRDVEKWTKDATVNPPLQHDLTDDLQKLYFH